MKTRFKNKGVEYTFQGVDWTGVELETIQELAFAQAKTQALDNWLSEQDGTDLGIIPMAEALNTKVARAKVGEKYTALRSAVERIKSGELTIADAIEQGLV